MNGSIESTDRDYARSQADLRAELHRQRAARAIAQAIATAWDACDDDAFDETAWQADREDGLL